MTSTFKRQPKLTELQASIIKEWKTLIKVHPSYPSIAKKLECSSETVQRAVKKFLTLNKK